MYEVHRPEKTFEKIHADNSPTVYCYTSFMHDEFDKIELDEKDSDVNVREKKSEEQLVDSLSLAGQQLKVLHVSYSCIFIVLLCNRLYNMNLLFNYVILASLLCDLMKLLQDVDEIVAWTHRLAKLDLSCNLLTTLPDSISMLTNLKVLDVSRNNLGALPETISHCR